MKIFKKIFTFALTLILTTVLLTCDILNKRNANADINVRTPIEVGVILYNFQDLYLSEFKQQLENIQKENENKVNFTFFDGNANPAIQDKIINDLITNNFDLLILNLVEKRAGQNRRYNL